MDDSRAPADSAVEELPDGLLRAGYRHRAAPDLSQPSRLFSRRLALITFAEAFASEEEDLGVFHQTIGNGGGDGGVVEDVAPVGESCVGRNERAALMAVAGGDDLIEEVGSVLIERKIPQFVDDQQSRLGIDLEFANQRVIDLRSEEMVEHVHGGREQHPLIRLTGAPADDLGQVGFAHAGIANDAHAGAVAQEVEIEQTQDSSLELEARLVMVEVGAVDGRLALQAGELEAAFNGSLVTGFEFAIEECFQGLGEAEIFGGGISQDLIQMEAHGRQVQLIQFLLQ